MIDINELRQSLGAVQPEEVSELLDRLETAERERDALRDEIACVKEVEFPRKAQAVADAWKGKCERLEAERDALRAKVERMEKQEPVAWFRGRDNHRRRKPSFEKPAKSSPDKFHWSSLYATPGAQAQPAPSFADAYQGAMEEVAIWKKRALEAEELTRKLVAEINGPVYMGEPVQPAPSVPDDGFKRAVMEIADIGYEAIFKRLLCERAAELAETAPKANP